MDPSRWSEVQQQQPPANPNPSADPYAYAHCYNAHQSSFPHYPLYSSHQSQILGTPSLLLPEIPSTAFLVSNPDAALRPPGTGTVHSYAALNSYLLPPPHAAAQVGGATYYQDPGIAHNWPAKDAVLQYGADPLANAAAGESPNKKTIVPQCPTTMSLKNNCINHPLANDRSPRREIVQSLQCKVCKIDCNSKHVFDQHILGKKHKRSLLKQKLLSKNSIAPGIAPIPKIPRRTKKKSLSGEVGRTIDQRMTMEPSVLAATDDLETKRQNLVEHGAEVDSVVVCGICNVVCNSFIMFSSHLAGKRHAAQAGVIPANGMDTTVHTNPNPVLLVNQVVHPALKKAMRRIPKKTKIVQSAWCEICKIDCNSKDVLFQHRLGKKHKKNLEKLEESKRKVSAPASAASQTTNNPVIGPPENPLNCSWQSRKKPIPSATVEDLETKRRKVMEGGAAAEAVRVCTVCNVVCNSEVVFNYHLAGQKHISMLKKQALVLRQ